MWLVDSNGKRMLDGVASMWCNVWGHSNTEMINAITRQTEKLQHSPLFNLTNTPAEVLANMLTEISPGMHRVFFSDNGSSAIEIALKMALQYWQNCGERKKTIIASLKNGYHGDTFGAMSAGYMPEFFGHFGRHTFKAIQFPVPGCRGPGGRRWQMDESIEKMEKTLANNSTIAALVMESGAQMAGGAVIFPEKFQSRVQRICRKYGVLLILDEIATGFGRLGSMVQYEHQGCIPDIVTYGKMLTGGYLSMAATLATKKIYDSFLGRHDKMVHLFHGHTYTGNPIAAAAAVKNLRMYKKYRLISRISRTSGVFADYVDKIYDTKSVRDVRTKGMVMGISVSSPRTVGSSSANKIFFEAARRNGLYLRTLGDVIMLVPPLAISRRELAMMIRRTIKTISDVANS